MPVAFESCFADSMRPKLGNIACSKRQEGWVTTTASSVA